MAAVGLIAPLLAAEVATAGSGGGGDTDDPITLTAVSGSNVDFISLPVLAAWEILAEDGIEVEQRFVEDGATAIQAMAQGDAVIGGNIGVNTGIPAVDAGADIVDVVATQRPTWALAAVPEITEIADLDGRRIGVHGETSFTRAVAQYYAQQYNFEYEELIIPGSDVRAEALAQGQIDASVIDLPDIVQLSATYPGSFEVLSTFGEQFPDLIEQDLWLTREWAEANPELATTVVAAVVEANRRLTDDTDYALDLAIRSLPDMDEDVLAELVVEYSERGIWAVDGLITPERALITLEFFNEIGEISIDDPTEETVATYFDFSYLEAALDELDGAE